MRKKFFLFISGGLMLVAFGLMAMDNPASTLAASPTATPTRKAVAPAPGNSKTSAPRGAFGTVTVVNTDTNTLHDETSIAIDPKNSNRVLATSRVWVGVGNQPYAYYYLSTDGGTTWTQGDTTKRGGAILGGNPWVTFDTKGNGYQIQTARTPDGIYLAQLSPSNVWTEAYPVTLTATGYNDRPFVAVDDTTGTFADRIYATWTWDSLTSVPPTGTIYMSYIDATNFPTSTFSSQVRVNAPFANASQWSYIAIGSDGAVYVAYVNYRTGAPNQILLAKSTDGGVSFTNTYTVSVANGVINGGIADRIMGSVTGTLTVNNAPALVTDPLDPNYLAAIWMDGYGCSGPNQCSHAHIVASRSTNGGATWSSPVVVNDDGDAGNRDHFMPALTVGPNGILHASWYDRRVALNCTNPYLYNVVYSSSSDWGLTWSTNMKVSTASSDPGNPNWGEIISSPYNATDLFVGLYSGIATTGDGGAVMPFWTDATTGVQNVVTSRATTPVTGMPIVSCVPAAPINVLYLPFIKK